MPPKAVRCPLEVKVMAGGGNHLVGQILGLWPYTWYVHVWGPEVPRVPSALIYRIICLGGNTGMSAILSCLLVNSI